MHSYIYCHFSGSFNISKRKYFILLRSVSIFGATQLGHHSYIFLCLVLCLLVVYNFHMWLFLERLFARENFSLQLEGTNKRQTRVRARPLYTDTSTADLIQSLENFQSDGAPGEQVNRMYLATVWLSPSIGQIG